KTCRERARDRLVIPVATDGALDVEPFDEDAAVVAVERGAARGFKRRRQSARKTVANTPHQAFRTTRRRRREDGQRKPLDVDRRGCHDDPFGSFLLRACFGPADRRLTSSRSESTCCLSSLIPSTSNGMSDM